MTKENEQSQDEKILAFPISLLGDLTSYDSQSFKKMYDFFKNAYVDLSSSEFFDDLEYRNEWRDAIFYLEDYSKPFENYSDEEIRTAVASATLVLEKNRKEVLNAIS